MGVLVDTFFLFYYIVLAWLEVLLPSIFYRKKYSLENKTVLVTGAASGIGRQIALQVATRKTKVVLMDVNEQSLKEVADELKAQGHRVHIQVCDVSRKEEIARAAQAIKSAVGEIDVLINNAGVAVMRSILDHSEAEIERTLQINLHAHFWTVRAFLPGMIARKSGHIVTVSSIAGLCGAPNLTAYCASKFGAAGLHESLRLELESSGLGDAIGMTLVAPFYVRTRLLQGAGAGRFAFLLPLTEPEDLARSIIKAIEHRREAVLVPWILNLMVAARGILPVKSSIALSNLFAINDGMKNAHASTLTYLPSDRR